MESLAARRNWRLLPRFDKMIKILIVERLKLCQCEAVCDPGYIQTPGLGSSTCGEAGVWSNSLECEVPLLLVHGGTVRPHTQPEILAFHAMTEVKSK